jgi:hypothetical protein
MEAWMRRIGRPALRWAFFSLFFFSSVSSPLADEANTETYPLTFLSGPRGQMRILVPMPLSGTCDVPWCPGPQCTGGCVAKWPILSDYTLEILLDGEKATRKVEMAVFPVTTYWKPGSVSWKSPWRTSGCDLFFPREKQKTKTLSEGKMKGWVKFDLMDGVREASREGLRIYGFAITTPIPSGMRASDDGLLPQDVGAIGKLKAALFRIRFDRDAEPMRFDVLSPPAED